MSEKFILYSTWGCHLCEQAEALMLQAGLQDQYQVVDIIDDEKLLTQFRVHIPVLGYQQKLLYWPFDAEQLQHWLKELN